MSTPENQLNLIRALAAKKESGKQRQAKDSAPRRHRGGRAFGWTLLVLLLLAATAFGLWRMRGWRGCQYAATDDAVADGGKDGATGGTSAGGDGASVGGTEKPGAAGDGAAKVQPVDPEAGRKAMMAFLTPSDKEVADWFEAIRRSTFVQTNAAYRALVETAKFHYDESDDRLEVVASRLDGPADDPCAGLDVPGGFGRLSRVMGAVLASEKHVGADASPRLGLLAGKVARVRRVLSAKAAAELVEECGLSPDLFLDKGFVKKAGDIADGVGLAAIGHEVGHVAHRHLWRTIGMNPDVFRDREFAADAFFCSVRDAEKDASVAGRMFAGNAYLLLANAARDEMDVASIARRRGAATPDALSSIRGGLMLERRHPYAGERLADQLANNESLFRQYGIDPAELASIIRSLETR